MNLGQLVPAILAGAIGSAGAWFMFARELVTRKEVLGIVRDRMEVLNAHQARQEQLIDAMRAELVALRGEVIRLGVLLGVKGARDPVSPTETNDTKGN